jgi:hypothetical protein
MARELEKRIVTLVQRIFKASVEETPGWLLRPGKQECGREWLRVCEIYSDLTSLPLPDVMRPIERRTVDAVLCIAGAPPRILEVDERQHFNEFRAITLRRYFNASVAFDQNAWLDASLTKKKLEAGGFARPMPPLFPGANGRHRQRAFRDALCDLLPPLYGFSPTLRIADFEVRAWINGPGAEERLAELVDGKIRGSGGADALIDSARPTRQFSREGIPRPVTASSNGSFSVNCPVRSAKKPGQAQVPGPVLRICRASVLSIAAAKAIRSAPSASKATRTTSLSSIEKQIGNGLTISPFSTSNQRSVALPGS